MTYILTVTFSLFFIGFTQSQNQPTNNTIIRLTIVNENGEILMRETKNGWMTPATYYKKRETINEVIDGMVKNYGIEITKPNLAGLFTYKYEFKTTSDIRLFFIAKHAKGELITSDENEKRYWMKKDEAIEKLKATVPSLGEMTKQVLDNPEMLSGGSFLLNKDENWKLSSKMVEEFYPLRDNQNENQLDYSSVEKTLQNYMDGSSYNQLDMLESAFTENATLYLTSRDTFKVFTPKEYVALFKNRDPGKFNGRYAKVLAIEVVKDIATAKVEISIPERKMVYIDLFLLKKLENGWKIISKTATRIDEAKDE